MLIQGLIVVGVFLITCSQYKVRTLGAQILLESEEKVNQKTPLDKYQSDFTPQLAQNFWFRVNGDSNAIHIVDPPDLSKTQRIPNMNSQHKYHYIEKADDRAYSPYKMVHDNSPNSLKRKQPTVAFLIQSESQSENKLMASNRDPPQNHFKLVKNIPPKLMRMNQDAQLHDQNVTPVLQLYPFQISSAVRHKQIMRNGPASRNPNVKKRLHTKISKTYQSNVLYNNSNFEKESKQADWSLAHRNSGGRLRTRRDTPPEKKSIKLMRGSLLPVALTIMGENGELLTGRALLQHITVLLKNASTFEPAEEDQMDDYSNGDVLLNDKAFDHIMENSMNLTDPAMLHFLGLNAVNNSSLLTNNYVNEYLNCIESSKITNRFQAIQNKIDCMKRKLFDSSNFDSNASSRYSISKLPATLVYADVMSNINKSVRPKNGIAFYSLPVDELTHLQQVVLPIEEYVSKIHNEHFAPRNYHFNRKLHFHENAHPQMPVWYVLKPDGRIYQTEGSRSQNPATIRVSHGFPDIPNADFFADRFPKRHFYESEFYDE